MNKIKISYKTERQKGGSLVRALPSSWAECTTSQAWALLEMLNTGTPKRNIAEWFIDIPAWLKLHIGTGEWFDIIRKLHWLDDLPLLFPIAPYIDIVKGHEDKRLWFPKGQFKDLTALEYAMLDDLHEQRVATEGADRHAIEQRMIALLIRPADTPGKRIPITGIDQIESWLPAIQCMTRAQHLYCMLFIDENRTDIFETYKDWLFSSSRGSQATDTENSPDEGHPATQSSPGVNFGWWGAYMRIAEDGTFGTYEQVLMSNFHNLCMYLVTKTDENRRIQEENELDRVKQKFAR